MKRSLIFLPLLLCNCLCLVAQLSETALIDLELAARAAFGKTKIEKSIVVADAYLAAGNFAKTEDWAKEAEELAQKNKYRDLEAAALNRIGKAWMNTEKRKGLLNKPRPAAKFLRSNELLRSIGSSDKALYLDNLQHLRILAQKAAKYDDIAAIDVQIQEIKNGNLLGTAPSNKQELEVRQLNQQLSQQKQAYDTTEAKANQLLLQSKELQAQLIQRESLLNQMTAEQMRATMVLMQKQQVLDSLVFRSRVDSLQLTNTDLQLKTANASRNFSFALAGILLLLAAAWGFGYFRKRQHAHVLTEKNKMIEAERERSENLLLNILPALVADELKKQGRTSARYFEDVGVLFADFVNFSKIAEKVSPQELVFDLDTCFKEFDRITSEYELEKIKTIGDCYMCASGMQNGQRNHLLNMVKAALEMQHWLDKWNQERDQAGQLRYDARIGIHRGAVVAGVVGSRKFAFDIWGDTVNIAARIEQAGEGGKINISGPVYQAIKHEVPCSFRGKIAAKNKGEIEMYFVGAGAAV